MENKEMDYPDEPPPPYPGIAPPPYPTMGATYEPSSTQTPGYVAYSAIHPPQGAYTVTSPNQSYKYANINPNINPYEVYGAPPPRCFMANGQPATNFSSVSGHPSNFVISQQPLGTHSMVTDSVGPKPQNYLALSIMTCLCFSPIFGLFAVCFSIASDAAYGRGDGFTARRHGMLALWTSIVGIIISVVILLVLAIPAYA